jgi:hypothetical protein
MKAAIGQIREEYAFSERRACRLLLLAVGAIAMYRVETMSPCGQDWWSWRGRSRASVTGVCTCCSNAKEKR